MVEVISRSVIKLSKLFGNNGSSIGGKVAYKLDKKILQKLSADVETIIVVTGTNGKTTTSNLIAALFDETIIHNAKGANMYYGVINAFLLNKSKYAVLEVDEGSVKNVLRDLKVDYLVVTNFFRDQLDRYSEIDMLVETIKNSIDEDTHLILNADDPFTTRLDNGNSSFYGMDKGIDCFTDFNVFESRYCHKCGKKLVYDKIFYSQLGYYNCSCGFKHPKVDTIVNKIENKCIEINGHTYKHHLSGNYNAYNIAAVSCLADLLDLKLDFALQYYHSEDGRMQEIEIDDVTHLVTLAKNPSGMNMSISNASDEYKNIVFVLNDLDLDGRDISWIWDADFELLSKDRTYYCDGTRKLDMSIRLKYAGIALDNIKIVNDLDSELDDILVDKTYLISSYTSIDKTRKLLEKRVK